MEGVVGGGVRKVLKKFRAEFPPVPTDILILIFSLLYVRLYQSNHDKELCSTLASVLGIAVSLFTCALVPVDIFLVSFMKDSDGHFKDWAKDVESRDAIVNAVLITYYVMYACLMLFFLLQ
ncbi:hypothetical protein NP493_49g09016 [Ridgeia piscesae]|uniref:Uncharacterized protein n=1 Tax=Ridgeia piscesae TaxID=27915 RepID=A0AAD9UJ75_RIDPI|nr:hypothetical protein NP493_49g09016 [Ridgeia piscesae]